MTVLDEILTWSSQQPEWQKDALRRLVAVGRLAPQELEQLATLCKRKHGLVPGDGPAASPLEEQDLPSPAAQASLVLTSLEHVSNVNALPAGQRISFGATGLTVVYGDNAAGKSGYARILKRACRARGAGDPVLPNVLSDQPGGPPSAKIEYTIDGNPRTCDWQDGRAADAPLSAISVFDTEAADVYIRHETDVAYRPLGLDLLDKLAKACEDVRGILEKEREQLRRAARRWEVGQGTAVARLLSSLSTLTQGEEIDALATLSPEEDREYENLREVLQALRADPASQARELRLRAERLKKLLRQVDELGRLAGPKMASDLADARKAAADARDASQAARALADGKAALPGFATPPWRELWDAAERYSTEQASPDAPFPPTSPGDRCVLCQQELDAEARARLAAFARYLADDSQVRADRAQERLDGLLREVQRGSAMEEPADLPELREVAPQLGEVTTSFVREAQSRCRSFEKAVRDGKGRIQGLDVPPPSQAIQEEVGRLTARANEITGAQDPKARAEKEARFKELEARRRLRDIKDEVVAEVRRLQQVQAFDAAIGDTKTNSVTRKGTELTKKYVSEALATGFEAEVKRLGFSTLELVLKPTGGSRGALYHQIEFKYATQASLPKVVSEGESRCLALAAFFAEAKTAPRPAPIVFDDPVCSLDHGWRERIAQRLAEEGRERQVIVFTHDLTFVGDLRSAAEEAGVPVTDQQVFRERNQPGNVAEGLPWIGQKTSERLGVLKQEWQQAEKLYRTGTTADYEFKAEQLYSRLRKTWERAIEEILLASVVQRFSKKVETQRLRDVATNEPQDYADAEQGMTRCSVFVHDGAAAANSPVPGPEEMKQDIEKLEAWVKRIRKRR